MVITDRWPQYENELEAQVARALVRAGRTGMVAGRAKASRYRISGIQGQVRVDVPTRHPRGWYIEIRWTDFRSRFFERGTYQKLGRRLTVRSKPGVGGNRGVKPQRFAALARRVGRVSLATELQRYLR